MKKIFLLFIILVIPFVLPAQKKYFRINSSVGDSIFIRVNGVKYMLDSNFTKIPTQYPAFDSLALLYHSGDERTSIVCNFHPDSSYSIIPACCATLDVVPSYKLKADSLNYWSKDYETYFENIKHFLMDKPHITFKIKNATAKDSIYAWYADGACMPSFKMINEKGWKYGTPVKCFYWSNISSFVFFKPVSKYKTDPDINGIYEDQFPYDYSEDSSYNPILAHVTTRLFYNEKFIITYDLKKDKILVTYENPPEKRTK